MGAIKSNEERAELHFSKSRFADAQELAVTVLAAQPDNGRMWLVSGLSSYRLRDFGLARKSLEHAGLLVPVDAEAQHALAECYLQNGQTAHAHSLWKHLATDENCSAKILPLVASGLGRVGDHQGALDVCRNAHAREPEQPEPLFGMTYYLRRLGYPASVMIPVMAKAFELQPGNSFYRSSLAFLLAEDGQTEDAYDLLKDLPVNKAGCACMLRRMMTLFQNVGDLQRWQECRERLHAAEDELKCSHKRENRDG